MPKLPFTTAEITSSMVELAIDAEKECGRKAAVVLILLADEGSASVRFSLDRSHFPDADVKAKRLYDGLLALMNKEFGDTFQLIDPDPLSRKADV